MFLRILFLLLLSVDVWAADPPLQLYDEGVKQGVIFNIDCSGAGISCSKSGTTGTLTVATGGGGSQWTTNGTSIYYNTGNVGIGSTNPKRKLDITGDFGLTSGSTIRFGKSVSEGGTGHTIDATDNDNLSIGGQNIGLRYYYTTASDTMVLKGSNVGIGGDTTPDATLEVVGNMFVSNGAGGNGNTLTVDSSTGNIGVGSTAPSKTVDVVGSIRASTDIMVGSLSVCRSDGTNCPASSGSPGGSTTNVQYNSAGSFAGSNNFVTNGTNVGIGTTLLGTDTFTVKGTGAVTAASLPTMYVRSLNVTDDDTVQSRLAFYSRNDQNVIGTIAGQIRAGVNYLEFRPGSTSTSRMALSETGNVGIGTVKPVGALVVTNGNVGIGTDTPLHLLSVQTAASGVAMILQDKSDPGGSQGLRILLNSKGNGSTAEDNLVTLSSTGAATGSIALAAGNTEVLRAASSSNVGIGTFNPNTKLHVGAGNASVAAFNTVSFGTGTPSILATNTSGIASIGAVVSDGTNNPRVNLFVDQTNFSWGLKNDFSSFTGSPFIIATGSGATEKMRIDYNGNVGLGTVNPQGRLQVGSIASTPFLIDSNGNVGIGTTAPLSVFQVGPGSGSGNVGIGSVNPTAALDIGGSGNIKVGGLGGSSGDILCRKADKTIGVCATSISGVGCTACN